MERSGDPTHTAALMNEGVGVPENAAKNDYRTPGVTITEPFVEEGPSVMCKPDEVATVCNGKIAAVSVYTCEVSVLGVVACQDREI
ncbi:hypothetical protein PF003_g11059 [Phytophthora fragariae]|nr:hypothetical protein PF003_g11059 [Phytophthora fragariae]